MSDYSALLSGTVDLHVHAGPSLMARRFDALEVGRAARRAGMRGLLLKDHYVPTQDMAALVRRELVRESGESSPLVYGAICLNASAGGFSPAAVEAALTAGARMVYLPTVTAAHHAAVIDGKERGKLMPTPPIRHRAPVPVPEDLERWDDWVEIAELIARHDAVLSTGHMDRPTALRLCASAAKRGVRRFLATHAMLFEPLDDGFIAAADALGMLIEITALPTVTPGFTLPEFGQPLQRVTGVLDRLGPDRVVLSSDCGHPEGEMTVTAFGEYLELLWRSGVPEARLRTMAAENPAALIEP